MVISKWPDPRAAAGGLRDELVGASLAVGTLVARGVEQRDAADPGLLELDVHAGGLKTERPNVHRGDVGGWASGRVGECMGRWGWLK